MVASAVPAAQPPRVEGVGELWMGIAATSATAMAGPVGPAGYATLLIAGAAAPAALGPFLIAVACRDEPAGAVRANRMLS